MILKINQVAKSFGKLQAVKDVSFEVPKGKICGLLGPNGAGKTTLIRMIMDIYQPDAGTIELGVEAKDRKNHIGYLPEERGLYAKVKVKDALIYFAMLKGLPRPQAIAQTQLYLEMLEMDHTADMQIRKLSKGNQQKIQIISAMVSDPELLILDEPFSGLDPVNTKMISNCIQGLREKGVTILLSTHQMNQAETFCDEIFLFNHGELILSGHLADIIDRYSGKYWMVETDQPLREDPLFQIVEQQGKATKIALSEGVGARHLLHWLADRPLELLSLKPFKLPLSEIFIQEVSQHA